MGSKGSNTTTNQTTTAANPEAMSAYSDVLQRAQGAANTPYAGYGGELVAGVNAQQNTGIQGINNNASWAQPYIQNAASLTQGAATPLTQQQIQSYMSPYTQNVVDATQRQFNNQNQIQQQGVLGNAISQGALGGNRSAVAQAETANQQQLAQAPVIAGLYNQAYQGGLNTAYQQYQQNPMAAGSLLGNLGVAGQSAGLQGAGAQIGAGTLQQGTQQAQDTANYGQFQNQQAFPYQQAQWLAGIDTGVGSQMGGTSNGQTTAPAPNLWGQIIGAGTAAAGAAGQIWSDRRLKENVKSIGKLHDGQIIYRFNYKGDNTAHIGLMAQDVEKHHPEAVHHVNGWKAVDYDAATHDAIKRASGGVASFAGGGWTSGVAGVPYSGAHGYIPDNTIAHGAGPPHASAPAAYNPPANDLSKQAASIGDIAKKLMSGSVGTPGDAISGASGPTSIGGPQGPMPLVGVASPADSFAGGMAPMNRGGVVGFADGGVVPDDSQREHGLRLLQQKFDANGTTRRGDGQWWKEKYRGDQMQDAQEYSAHIEDDLQADRLGKGRANNMRMSTGFADGGTPLYDDSDTVNPGDPVRMYPKEMQAWRDEVDHPNAALVADASTKVPTDQPPITSQSNGVVPPTRAMAFSGQSDKPDTSSLPSEVALGYSGQRPPMKLSGSNGIAPSAVRAANEDEDVSKKSSGIDLSRESKLWPSLMSAGFGMMASRSPFLGNAIGEGGQAGIASYNAQQKRQEEAEQHADKLDLERQKFERPYNQLTLSEQQDAAQKKIDQAIKLKTPVKVRDQYLSDDASTMVPALYAIPKLGKNGQIELYEVNRDGTVSTTPIGSTPTGSSTSVPGAAPPPAPTSSTPAQPPAAAGATPVSFNYARSGPPSIEKGADVPEPTPLIGHSPDSIKKDAESYLIDGKLTPVRAGNSPVAVAQNAYRTAVQNYGMALAASRGLTPAEVAENQRAAPGINRFILGAPGQSVTALGNATRHIGLMEDAIKAYNASDWPALRNLQARLSSYAGYTGATDIAAISKVVGPEIIKAIGVAGAGGIGEREEAALLGQQGTAQSLSALARVKGLLGEQLHGKELQGKEVGVSHDRFRRLTGEKEYDQLVGKAGGAKTLAPADQEALDWANKNPLDPRASTIKRRLKVE